MRAAILCFGLMGLWAVGVSAAEPKLLGTFGDWRLFQYDASQGNVCYIASVPVQTAGTYKQRSTPFAMVTQRSAGVDEVSISSGYPYKDNSKVAVSIGSQKYEMFIKDDRAWAYDASQDNRMVGAMVKGSSMTARGTSRKDTFSLDTYSLKGITQAHREMKARCR